MTFTTAKAPAPGSPTLGKTFNISLVSGLVLVKIHGVFVPLTELTQIPTNTRSTRSRGSIKLTTAINGGAHPASDAAAKGKKPKPKTQTGTFGGAVFKITQARNGAAKGLVTLAIERTRSKAHPPTRSAPRTRPPTPPPPPPRPRPSSYSTPAPRASSAPRAATAPPPSSEPNGRSLTAATAPSPTTSPTQSKSPTSSATRRSSSTPARATSLLGRVSTSESGGHIASTAASQTTGDAGVKSDVAPRAGRDVRETAPCSAYWESSSRSGWPTQ